MKNGEITARLKCVDDHHSLTMKTSGSNKPITIRGEKKLYYEYHCPECKNSVWLVVKDRTATLLMDEESAT